MKLTRAEAVFGRLQNQRLAPGPGLNIITGPNESGKSSWVSFLVSMLYGIDTSARKKGDFLPDKLLYAPWSGRRMEGELLLETEQGPLLLRRTTQRAGAPLQRCTVTDPRTGEEREDLRGGAVGEALTGASREMYTRSACIGREGLAVSGSPALERKISALITGGDEESSAAEALALLNKWSNSLDRTGTGRIQAVEAALSELREQERRRQALSERSAALREELRALEERRGALSQRLAACRYVRARAARDTLAETERALRETEAALAALKAEGPIPEEAALSGLQAREQAAKDARLLRQRGEQAQAAAEEAARRAEEDPALRRFPGWQPEALWQRASEDGALLRQLRAEQEAPAPRRSVLWPVLALALGALLLALGLWQDILWAAVPGGGLLLAGALLLLRSRPAAPPDTAPRQREVTGFWQAEEPEDFLALAADVRSAAERCQERQARAEELRRETETLRRRERTAWEAHAAEAAALGLAPETELETLRARRARWERMNDRLRRLRAQAALERERLGALPETAAGEPLPGDTEDTVLEALKALDRKKAQVEREQAETAGALGQFPLAETLEARRAALETQAARAAWNKKAVQAARDAIAEAQSQMRLRFAPELNARAGEYLSAFTGGRYREMLVSREFVPQARAGDALEPRGVPEVSRGTGDQMYLALRLALCDMTLPEKPPLLLDDALLAFDGRRLEAVLRVLQEKGRQQQILLFTCQDRERRILEGARDVTFIDLEATDE